MNLQKLFEMQAVLDADIIKRHPVQSDEDRLSKKILALLVELGECANEWRGFKFWSKDQEPRGERKCRTCGGTGDLFQVGDCDECKGAGTMNKLLEEYVDCLHFILSIGNDLNIDYKEIQVNYQVIDEKVDEYFVEVFISATNLQVFKEALKSTSRHYKNLFRGFLNLGFLLGFTEEQIEQAYYSKNKINFERQATGY